jgi:hypothetical protein
MGQFDEVNETMPCLVCEAMCPEAVDGTLTAVEQAAFDKHVAGCVHCSEELAEAHRGAAWMQMLKGHAPEPPAALLAKILAETSGAVAGVRAEARQFATPPIAQSARDEWATQIKGGWWANVSSKLSATFSMQSAFSPRLAMTAAMAFFSIALTLNMAGVRVKDFHASMLKPSSIGHSVSDLSASATRSFQNLRVVYEFESRVNDMRNNGDLGQRYEDQRQDSGTPFAGSQKDQPQQQQEQKPQQPQGKSSLELPLKPNEIVEKGA